MNRLDAKHAMLGLPLLAGLLLGIKFLCLWAYRVYVFVGLEVPATVDSPWMQHLFGFLVASACACAAMAVGFSMNLGEWLTKKDT